jgi:hypothetical protein
MYFTIRTEQVRVIVWLIWFIAVMVFWLTPWSSPNTYIIKMGCAEGSSENPPPTKV